MHSNFLHANLRLFLSQLLSPQHCCPTPQLRPWEAQLFILIARCPATSLRDHQLWSDARETLIKLLEGRQRPYSCYYNSISSYVPYITNGNSENMWLSNLNLILWYWSKKKKVQSILHVYTAPFSKPIMAIKFISPPHQNAFITF